tara:strand:- start:329 stop:511 length:183 start_codon:yes stop_codon:yes gene_type:complete
MFALRHLIGSKGASVMNEGYKRVYPARTTQENLEIWFFAERHGLSMGEVEEMLYIKEQGE